MKRAGGADNKDQADLNPRTCIVTGKAGDADEMIRFVASPDGVVTPDLKRRLPGRGVWVGANRQLVGTAVAKRLFARGLKQDVKASGALAGEVEALLFREVAGALGMARKAGLVVTGFAKCDSAIRTGKAMLVLHAADAADDGKRKLAQAVHMLAELGGGPVTVNDDITREQLDLALGGSNVVHAVAMHGGASEKLASAIARLQHYRTPMPQSGQA